MGGAYKNMRINGGEDAHSGTREREREVQILLPDTSIFTLTDLAILFELFNYLLFN